MDYPVLKIDKFFGIFTRGARSTRPVGALDDSLNLVPITKTGKLALRSGYTTDISTAITEVGGNTTITAVQNLWKTQTENPTTTNIDVVAGTAGASVRIFQKPFFKFSATATDSWVNWGETHSTSISAKDGDRITYTLAAGSDSNDYYNGWIVWNETGARQFETAMVLDYNGTTKKITLAQTTAALVADEWQVNDTLFLKRFNHNVYYDNASAPGTPTFGTDPCCLQQGNNILFSGGQAGGANERYKPFVSEYINAEFFPDDATNKFTYQGTYVHRAGPVAEDGANAFFLGGSGSGAVAEVTDPLPAGFQWYLIASLETFDGQKSSYAQNSGSNIASYTVDADERIDYDVFVRPEFNKNIRYINLFAEAVPQTGATDPTDFSGMMRVKQIDLTASEGFTWSYDQNPGTAIGNAWLLTVSIKGADWAQRGPDWTSYTGTASKYGNTTLTSAEHSADPSFSRGAFVASRLFVGKYYDHNAGLNVNNTIRFSGFGDGLPQFNVLPNIGDFSETTIGYGDESNVQQLLGFENNLIVFKTGSVSYINVTDDPSTWVQVPIQKYSGCDAPFSVVTTPYGIVWANSGDDIYLWSGGTPKSLCKNWLATYRAFTTTPASWMAWYNEANKSYNITINMSDKTIWYEMFFELPIDDAFVWVRHQGNDAISWVHTRADGTVYFVKSSSDDSFYFNSAATLDNATAIKPYFDTGDYVVDEGALIRPIEWYLSVSGQGGSPSGTLDAKLYIDGTSLTVGGSNPYAGLTTSNAQFNMPCQNINGKRMRFEFNTNDTKASLGTSYVIEEFGLRFSRRKRVGDAALVK
jgi:hypothetical protein